MDLTEYGIVVILNGFGKNKNMKKDLILITAFCNNDRKTSTLRNLVNSIKESEKFDILISSHSPLPSDIVALTDYFFYDSKNILLTDFDLRSAAWFNPLDGNGVITSIFVGAHSTHLAVWRLVIFGNKIAKSIGYNKVHHIEYDTKIDNVDELIENSKLLDSNDAVIYTIDDDYHHKGLFLGSFCSYRLDTLAPMIIEYDEESILNMIRSTNIKTAETFLKKLLITDKKFFEKKITNFKKNGMQFGLSKNKPEYPAWCIPYYDTASNKLNFIVWNAEGFQNLNVKLVYNNLSIYNFTNVNPNEWRTAELGNYDESEELIVLVNNKVRNIYDFTKIKDTFKIHSYRNKL